MPRRLALHPSRLLVAPSLRHVREGRGELAIDGLVCSICARRTERALQSVSGVERASVDLAAGRATIQHRGPEPSPEALRTALDGAVIAPAWRRRIEAWAGRVRSAGRLRLPLRSRS